MSKRPAFQLYASDWLGNAKLRRCSEGARGAWIDVMCLMHDSDEYGVLRWPLADIARAAGVGIKYLKELVEKGVLKGGDKGCAAYIYTPRHAGRDGEPVELLAATDRACWYCSRFVRDEYIRQRRGGESRFDSETNPRKAKPKAAPKPTFGDGDGDGPSSSSSSSNNTHTTAGDPRLDAAGLSAQHSDGWQPDMAKLSTYLQRAGIPMPAEAGLANSLTRFNLHFAGKALTESQRYSKLVTWLTGDHRNAQRPAPVVIPVADHPAAARKLTPLEQVRAARERELGKLGG